MAELRFAFDRPTDFLSRLVEAVELADTPKLGFADGDIPVVTTLL